MAQVALLALVLARKPEPLVTQAAAEVLPHRPIIRLPPALAAGALAAAGRSLTALVVQLQADAAASSAAAALLRTTALPPWPGTAALVPAVAALRSVRQIPRHQALAAQA
jgi:hypothetical protein